ncbi:MAG: hypothetical protein A6D91_07660 [Bacillaceae bacterium G1]|nr:hypothetical protein [Bacillota bacterium]OJF17728.1 MAG: hypothetical protein A6D91_07660 [Bacillaceae bacterium G1]
MIRFTEEAWEMIRRIRESVPEALIMVVGSGCCDGLVPQLYPASQVPVRGTEVYREEGLTVTFHEPVRPQEGFVYIIDLERDVVNDGFSLEGRYDARFVLRAVQQS